MIYLSRYFSPLGEITLSANENALTGLWFDGQKHRAEIAGNLAWILREDLPVFKETRAWLDAYFRGENPSAAAIPLEPSGSEFRLRVWEALCEIPYGKILSYGELAGTLGQGDSGTKTSPRAVGGAVGRNPIALIIPCHRVVGKSGKLCGYAGGIPRKEMLLRLEKSLLV